MAKRELKDLFRKLFARGKESGPISLKLGGEDSAGRAKPAPGPADGGAPQGSNDKGDLDSAIAAFRQAVLVQPNNAAAHYNLGKALRARGDLYGAIATCREATRLQPGHANARLILAEALRLKGDMDGAIAEWRAVIRFRPDLAGAHDNLGIALLMKGDLDGAVNSHREAIRLQSNHVNAHANLGNALFVKLDLEGAVAEYREAIRLQPNHANAHADLGSALLSKGDLDEAIAEYCEAIRLQPNHATAHYSLGRALEKKGNPQKALEEYHKAITLAPKVPASFREAYEKLRLQLKTDGGASPSSLGSESTASVLHSGTRAPGNHPQAGHEHPAAEGSYKKGDVIGGTFRVHHMLGRGGCGEVYLVYNLESHGVHALKTFRQELLANAEAMAAFKREALLWVNLGRHPNILPAIVVLQFSGRLFVAMDHVAPDERGRVTLADHLRQCRGPIDTDLALTWAIHFCRGMEHSNAHGIKCHRDIKPSNALIRQDGTLLVSDFGLATAAEEGWKHTAGAWVDSAEEGSVGLSLFQNEGRVLCGTPGYIAPEIFEGSEPDVRSDIYGFGLVLWQMATGSQVPPFAVGLVPRNQRNYAFEINERQKKERAPAVVGPLQAIIERCLALEPSQRFASFTQLRAELEPILKHRCGRTVDLPPTGELSASYWNDRGISFHNVGRLDEAMACIKKALQIQPDLAFGHYNLGMALYAKRDFDGAIAAYREAIRLRPDYAQAHTNLGAALEAKGDLDDAMAATREAIRLQPDLVEARLNLANWTKGDLDRAICEYREVIRLQPDLALGHYALGNALYAKRDVDGAIAAYREALRLRPDYAAAHNNLGNSLLQKNCLDAAIAEYRAAIRFEPSLYQAHASLGKALDAKGDADGAVAACREAVRLQPDNPAAHHNLGQALGKMGDSQAAFEEYQKACMLAPNVPAFRQTYERLRQQLEGSRNA